MRLRHVSDEERHDRSDAASAAQRGDDGDDSAKEAARRDYFFSTGVSEWYSKMPPGATFQSIELELRPEEARIMVSFWQSHCAVPPADAVPGAALIAGAARSPVEMLGLPNELLPLAERIDETIQVSCPGKGVFVKLSTRSPKDAKLALRAAGSEYRRRLGELGVQDGTAPKTADDANRRIILLADVQAASLRVTSGRQAVELLLDSERVAEDLTFALEAPERWNVSVSAREWCPDITLHSEWRGFVWGGTLNGLGQYYHPLMFPELQVEGLTEKVGQDCLRFFEATISPVLKELGLANCIVDFAWLGPGRVLLVEVNPFDGVLGSFSVSTGLFHWEDAKDQEIMQRGPFEVRIRRHVQSLVEMKEKMNPDWRRIVFGA